MNLSSEAQDAMERGEFLCRVFGYEACLQMGWTTGSAQMFLNGHCPVHTQHIYGPTQRLYVDEDYRYITHPRQEMGDGARKFHGMRIVVTLLREYGLDADAIERSFSACKNKIMRDIWRAD